MILVQQCIVISKNSAIDIAFRKALLSLSEHKNEPEIRKSGKRLLKFRKKKQYIKGARTDAV